MSTTAEKLNQLSLDKSAIKTAIEAKKGTALATPNDFGTYAPEIDNLPTGVEVFEECTHEWYVQQRNPKWLDIESLVTEVDRTNGGKIVLLFPIHPDGTFFKFRCINNFKVDWGNGIVEDYNNAYAEHAYDFNSVKSPVLSDGTKQVIISITANSGSLTYFRPYNNKNKYPTSILEMLIIGEDISDIYTQYMYSLEYLNIIGNHSIRYGILNFQDPSNIKYLHYPSSSTVSSYQFMLRNKSNPLQLTIDLTNINNLYGLFYYCYNDKSKISFVGTPVNAISLQVFMKGSYLKEIPTLDYSKGYMFYDSFRSCRNLVKTPLIDLVNSTTNNNLFRDCLSLKEINIINCTKSPSFYGCKSLPLSQIIKFGLTGIVDLTGRTEENVDFQNSFASDELKDLGDDGTYSYSGTDYTKSQILSIFIDKNWTLKY